MAFSVNAKSRQYPAELRTVKNKADDLALLANTFVQVG